jgi:superfamily II DNA or RNA helicase
MTLSVQCKHDFSSSTRQEGDRIYKEQKVDFLSGSGQRLLALVTDNSRMSPDSKRNIATKHQVLVSLDDLPEGIIDTCCDCRLAQRHFLCQHVWSVLRELDSVVDLSHIPNSGRRSRGRIDVYVERELKLEEPGIPVIQVVEAGKADPAHDWAQDSLLSRIRYRQNTAPARTRKGSSSQRQGKDTPVSTPPWQSKLFWMREVVEQYGRQLAMPTELTQPVDREAWYVLSVERSLEAGGLVLYLYQRARRQDGKWGKIKTLRISEDEVESFPRPSDRELLELLLQDAEDGDRYGYYSYRRRRTCDSVTVRPIQYEQVLSRACMTERLLWIPGPSTSVEEGKSLAWDPGGEWELELALVEGAESGAYELTARFVRGTETLSMASVVMVLGPDWLILDNRIARLKNAAHFGWISVFRRGGAFTVPRDQACSFVEELGRLPHLPRLVLPEDLPLEQVTIEPQPLLAVSNGTDPQTLTATIHFSYGEQRVRAKDPQSALIAAEGATLVVRDRGAEERCCGPLYELGFVRSAPEHQPQLDVQFPARELPHLVRHLLGNQWRVEAEGTLFRSAGSFHFQVMSDVNWFELDGEVDFEGVQVPLPRLLTALRKKEQFIRLDDGTHGMIPEQWLERYSFMADLAETAEGRLRFTRSQTLLLDALLADHHPVVDETFADFRERLRNVQGVQPAAAPEGFIGSLREYQKEGLGWLHFLREMRLGGCLADDMGLGKTIQVLAMLEARRLEREALPDTPCPSLVIVPKSLVFNWLDEAKRFTPGLRVLNYTGIERSNCRDQLGDFDLVVTTYGTLRRDIVELKEIEFDYVILDEAQAIKNGQSQSAKATRLLRAQHRLAMTGTPVENHLGELWSLFEFLNPGMLGRASAFQRVTRLGADDTEDLARLARGLRPFLLRRTKEQVLDELPEKSEQTLFCELSPRERAQYNELREYYRQQLMGKVAQQGMAKSKIHVLEALLRLRQAACHPGLLDPKHIGKLSAKLETLLEQLDELVDEGHKALVFSQFTSLLAIVRKQLDKRKIPYQYLDGQTRDRRGCVEQFQQGSDFPIFLISLKAGGHGLNLTAADYVFILDPWWNPAVEAQAVDRAHRIGQERHVFAYRLICRDTVEEKILELQQQKRELADAIISENNSVLQNLTMEDLDLLLS